MDTLSPAKKFLSLVLKWIAFVSAVVGTILSAWAGAQSFMGGKAVFMYFTIQSNISLAVISGIGFVLLLRNKPVSNLWYLVQFMQELVMYRTGSLDLE